jgi:hypothetical protein
MDALKDQYFTTDFYQKLTDKTHSVYPDLDKNQFLQQ